MRVKLVQVLIGGIIGGWIAVRKSKGYERCLRILKSKLNDVDRRDADPQLTRLEKRVASLESLIVEEEKRKSEEKWQALEK